jgi:PAS domain S-box-containing protein
MQHRMAALKISTLEDYLQYLAANPEEADALGQDIRGSLTAFFRDAKSFETLKREVFPRLIKGKIPEDFIRVWVVGCSTGQEPYSVAISLVEFLEQQSAAPRVRVFATDDNDADIQKARSGLYPNGSTTGVSSQRLKRFFVKDEQGCQVIKSIRDLCIFAKHDLTRDPPFSKLDLICCRNILTHLKPATQQDVLRIFHYALRPEGYLLLGRRGSFDASRLFFEVNRGTKVYQRRPTIMELPLGLPLTRAGAAKSSGRHALDLLTHSRFELQRQATNILFDRYAPAAVIIGSDFQVQYFLARSERYLKPPRGNASLDLLRMVGQGLARDLRLMLQQARDKRGSVRRSSRRVSSNGDATWVNLEVVPLRETEEQSGYFMVIFEPAPDLEVGAPQPGGTSAPKGVGRHRARETQKLDLLRRNLEKTRRSLEAALKKEVSNKEELRAANEQILSANEDLQSTNEELQTAQEELQSANEELIVLNQALQGQNAELSTASDDLENLLRSVDVAVFVDKDLRVRRFTPGAVNVLGITPKDLGRSVCELCGGLEISNFGQVVADTMATATPFQAEVRDKDYRWYSFRVRPYKTNDGGIAGAVLFLTDIHPFKSKLACQQGLLAEFQERCQRAFERSIAGSFRATPEGKILDCNQAFVRLCGGGSREQALESSFQQLCGSPSRWTDLIERLKSKENITEHEVDFVRKDGSTARVLMNIGLVKERNMPVIEGSILDITGPREAEASVREMARRLAEIQDEERQRFGRQLHDVVGSALVALNMNLSAVRNTATDGRAGSVIEEALALGKDVLQQVRTLSYLLHPPLMHDLGSDVALRLYVDGFGQRAGIKVRLEMPQDLQKFPPELEMTLFRILQESLSNIHRHSESKTASVRLGTTRDTITLEVSDEGEGFVPALGLNGSGNPGLGLTIVRERAQAAGGQLDIRSVPGQGTSLRVVLPLGRMSDG